MLSHPLKQEKTKPVSTNPRPILVVDDDPVIRDMMVDILSFEGYSIQVARNGREALEKLHQDEHYLVFLDMMMPGMDGREVCLRLNAEPRIRQRHIIIIMSALDNLVETEQLNADAIMPKPFEVEDILRFQYLMDGEKD
jgi:CheY-like chemotaxis protein